MQRSFYLIVLAVIMISATPMLVRHSRRQQRLSGADQYSSFSVNVIVEFTKAVITLAAMAWQYLYHSTSPSSTTSTVSSGVSITPTRRFLAFFTFCIPAFLYAVDNNIFFLVMSLINPQTFHLFNNIKIVFVAVLCRVFLNKLLSNIQWSSLAMLLVGLLVSELDVLIILLRSSQQTITVLNSSDESIWVAFGLVCLMALCSSFANIYLEHVYKTAGGVLLHQNLQLYLYGTVFNLVGFVLATNGAYGGDFAIGAARHGNLQGVGFFDGYSPLVWLVVIFNALTGIVISLILKYTDNITNVWAHAAGKIYSSITFSVFQIIYKMCFFFYFRKFSFKQPSW